jgi:hypothetical protein
MNPKKKPLDGLVLGSQGRFVVNQKSPIFNDRRTKRERDKSSKTRKAIERSSRDE